MKIASLSKAGLSKSFTFKNRSTSKRRDAVEGEDGRTIALPPLVHDTLDYLHKRGGSQVEGIFRVTGVISDVERLAKEYEKGREVQLHQVSDIHTVAGLLKHYLRTRPGGLITTRVQGCFLVAGAMQDEDIRVLCLAKALKAMPTINTLVLMKTCEYLYEVQKHEEVNKMSLNNLAIVFGSTFLPADTDNFEKAVIQTAHATTCVETLIRFHKRIMVHAEVEHAEEESSSLDVSVFGELLNHPTNSPKKSSHRKSKINSEPDLRKRSSTVVSVGDTVNLRISPLLPSPTPAPSPLLTSSTSTMEEPKRIMSNIFRKKSNGGLEAEVMRRNSNKMGDNAFLSAVLAENICGRAEVEALVHHLMAGDAETYYKQLQNLAKGNAGFRESLQLAALHTCREQRKIISGGIRLVA